MKHLLSLVSCAILIYSCSNNPCKNCGCDNVDDCLSKYKFVEARKYVSKEDSHEQLAKIFLTESKYWFSEKQFNRALDAGKELVHLGFDNDKKEYIQLLSEIISAKIQSNDLNEIGLILDAFDLVEGQNKIKTNCYFKIISKYCENGNINEAKNFTQNLPEKIVSKENRHIKSDLSNLNDEIEDCRIQYNEIRQRLKSNQEIEPFKKAWETDYVITTYEYPRKEAMKIIEEYKSR